MITRRDVVLPISSRCFFFSGSSSDSDDDGGNGSKNEEKDDKNKTKEEPEKKKIKDRADGNSHKYKAFSKPLLLPSNLGIGENCPRYPHMHALPVIHRPVFPGVLTNVMITDPTTIAAMEGLAENGNSYIGVFLRKTGSNGIFDGGMVLETPELIKNQEDLYSVGTFAQIHRFQREVGLDPSTMHADQPRNGIKSSSASSSSLSSDEVETETENGEESDKEHSGEAASVLLLAHRRIDLLSVDNFGPPIDVTAKHWDRLDYNPVGDSSKEDMIRALCNEVLSSIREIAASSPMFREQIARFPLRIDTNDPYSLADFATSVSTGTPEEQQAILEEKDVEKRLHMALLLLAKEREVSRLQQEISKNVEQKMSEQQRKYLLNEQLKSIKKELGMEVDDKEALIEKYRKKLKKYEDNNKDAIPTEVRKVIDDELEKLSSLEKNSSEFNVTRSYLDWLTDVPWGILSDELFDLDAAKKVLDRDHYGMDEIKDAIMQFIAVGKLKGSIQGKIICLVGPPGTGKTSIAQSIAHALGREFFRFSVGGLGDVSEIKGHRRTYVGAMPGKFIQGLKSTGTTNPLVLIDEIDKLGRDYRGDPSSALLEVLDPSQNSTFRDHFMDVPVDMSQVLFVCTANDLDTIPGPLLDRMEVISLSGYDVPDKVAIAEQYLIPKSLLENGLLAEPEKAGEKTDGEDVEESRTTAKKSKVDISDLVKTDHVPDSLGIDISAVHSLVRWYCREAGVRNLAKHIDKITRKLALQVVAESEGMELAPKMSRQSDTWSVSESNLSDYVGKPRFTSDRLYEKDPLPSGIVMGLAYTSMGGSALYIETQGIRRSVGSNEKKKGGGSLKVTGRLGETMSESTQIAYTVARSRLYDIDKENTYFDENDIHLHVPEGATPKDGPSAGVTLVTAMLSLALGKPVRNDLAMTGEVSLTGKVLPVGGIKEKTMAARRAGTTCIVFPEANKRDYDEIPEYLKEDLEVHFADEYSKVFDVAFGAQT
jgi:Lon-like ATP-dependent protease